MRPGFSPDALGLGNLAQGECAHFAPAARSDAAGFCNLLIMPRDEDVV